MSHYIVTADLHEKSQQDNCNILRIDNLLDTFML